jgi:hypothetical protein
MDTTDVTAHVEQLGSEVALADDKLESHLHQVFDHELSSIGGRTSSETAAAALASAQAPLREALRSPETLRQAIIFGSKTRGRKRLACRPVPHSADEPLRPAEGHSICPPRYNCVRRSLSAHRFAQSADAVVRHLGR